MRGVIFGIILLLNVGIASATDRFIHSNNVQKVIIQDKFVDLRVSDLYRVYGVPVTDLGLDYYYKVISDAERDRLSEAIAQKVFEKLLELEGREQVPTIPNGPTPNPTPETPPVTPEDQITAKVVQLFKVNCAACHSGPEGKSGLSLFDKDGVFNKDLTTAEKWNIFDRVDGSNLDRSLIMPKNGKPLAQEDVDLVREWVRK